MSNFKTLSGDFYVGMKLTDCKTDKQKKEFQRINALDGKLQDALTGEDICRERDSENIPRKKFSAGMIGGGLLTLGSGFGFGVGVAGALVGSVSYLWDYETDRNTELYKKEHGIQY